MLAPNVNQEDRVVLFDGVCKLCSAWAKFLIKYDNKRNLKLATVQSSEGRAILEWFGLPSDNYKTMVYVEGEDIYTQSTAFIRVMSVLPFPWRLFCVFWIIPRPIRNWLYDRIALNRYAIFGKYESCLLPEKDHESRFLGDN